MARIFKWLVFAALAVMLTLAGVACTLQRLVGSDGFRQRMVHDARAALGVPVSIDQVAVALWPLPAVALSGVVVHSTPPLALVRVELRPQWLALLQGRLAFSALRLRRAVLPQQGVNAVLFLLQKKKQMEAVTLAPKPGDTAISGPEIAYLSGLPRRIVLDDVTWVSAAGARSTLAAEARLGADGLPDSVSLTLFRGHRAGLRARLARTALHGGGLAPDVAQWALQVDVGGGLVKGQLGLQQGWVSLSELASGAPMPVLLLRGQLETRGVEVSALTATDPGLTGQLDATTTFHAQAATTGALAEALQTTSTFSLHHAVLHGVDLARAVHGVGQILSGQTLLDALSGQFTTQGRSARFGGLSAHSKALSATGELAVSPARALSGQVHVALAGGGAAVPLNVGGTVDAPEFTLSRPDRLDR
jgi:hypothetical protein